MVCILLNVSEICHIIRYMKVIYCLRRYLPGTVLSRWRTRLSVSVHFSFIEAASRGPGIDWVCIEPAGNPCKAVRGVCRSVLKRTVMRIWREGTCLSKYKAENGTYWMRRVLAEWERYLQWFEIGWNASNDNSFFIPVWNTTTAYHLRNSVCTCDFWDVHNVIRTCSQATTFFTYTCMNKIWWLCLVPISTTRFARAIQGKHFGWTMTSNPLT